MKDLLLLILIVCIILICCIGVYKDPAGWIYVYISLPGQSMSDPLWGHYFYTDAWKPAVFPTDIPAPGQ